MTPEIQEAIDLAVSKTLAAVGKGVDVAEEIVDKAGNKYKRADAAIDKFLVRFAKKDFSTAVIFAIAITLVVVSFGFGRMTKGDSVADFEVEEVPTLESLIAE